MVSTDCLLVVDDSWWLVLVNAGEWWLFLDRGYWRLMNDPGLRTSCCFWSPAGKITLGSAVSRNSMVYITCGEFTARVGWGWQRFEKYQCHSQLLVYCGDVYMDVGLMWVILVNSSYRPIQSMTWRWLETNHDISRVPADRYYRTFTKLSEFSKWSAYRRCGSDIPRSDHWRP